MDAPLFGGFLLSGADTGEGHAATTRPKAPPVRLAREDADSDSDSDFGSGSGSGSDPKRPARSLKRGRSGVVKLEVVFRKRLAVVAKSEPDDRPDIKLAHKSSREAVAESEADLDDAGPSVSRPLPAEVEVLEQDLETDDAESEPLRLAEQSDPGKSTSSPKPEEVLVSAQEQQQLLTPNAQSAQSARPEKEEENEEVATSRPRVDQQRDNLDQLAKEDQKVKVSKAGCEIDGGRSGPNLGTPGSREAVADAGSFFPKYLPAKIYVPEHDLEADDFGLGPSRLADQSSRGDDAPLSSASAGSPPLPERAAAATSGRAQAHGGGESTITGKDQPTGIQACAQGLPKPRAGNSQLHAKRTQPHAEKSKPRNSQLHAGLPRATAGSPPSGCQCRACVMQHNQQLINVAPSCASTGSPPLPDQVTSTSERALTVYGQNSTIAREEQPTGMQVCAPGSPQPHTENAQPRAGNAQPHAGNARPHAGNAQPHTGNAQPHAGSPQLHAGVPPAASGSLANTMQQNQQLLNAYFTHTREAMAISSQLAVAYKNGGTSPPYFMPPPPYMVPLPYMSPPPAMPQQCLFSAIVNGVFWPGQCVLPWLASCPCRTVVLKDCNRTNYPGHPRF